MEIRNYLDSTYLKTADQAGISAAEDLEIVKAFVLEAIREKFKLVMLRPNHVKTARQLIEAQQASVLVGTVIGFPSGEESTNEKLLEATQALSDGADELDFVVNFPAFKNGETALVKQEILDCTTLVLSNHKTVKWILETAALDDLEIARLSALVKNVVVSNFKEDQYSNVFVKSSTGFYQTEDSKPNGATSESLILMLENACPLPVKASGGIKDFETAVRYIQLGVSRIGTSSAREIAARQSGSGNY